MGADESAHCKSSANNAYGGVGGGRSKRMRDARRFFDGKVARSTSRATSDPLRHHRCSLASMTVPRLVDFAGANPATMKTAAIAAARQRPVFPPPP